MSYDIEAMALKHQHWVADSLEKGPPKLLWYHTVIRPSVKLLDVITVAPTCSHEIASIGSHEFT